MQTEKLSDRQKELLIAIFRSMKAYGKAPSYSEMVQNLDVSSKQAIADLLLHLNDKGFITISENKHRGIYLSATGIKALVDYGAIKEEGPQVLNGHIFYEYQNVPANSSSPKDNPIFQAINNSVSLAQAESNNTSDIQQGFENLQKSLSFTEFNKLNLATSENKKLHQAYVNFQNTLFIINPNLRKYFSENTVDFKPNIKTEGIFSFFKELLGI